MKADQERVKNLLIDTVTLLCKNSLTYDDELCVEGLLGVKVDQKDVFFVHISETFPSALSVQKAKLQAETEASLEEQPPPPKSSNKRPHQRTSDSPSFRDSPSSRGSTDNKVNVKTEQYESDDDACIISEEPPVQLQSPSSYSTPAERIAGQRRTPRSPRSTARQASGDQSSFQSTDSLDYQEYPEFSHVGKEESNGEPPRKRQATGDGGGEEDSFDDGSESQWPNISGTIDMGQGGFQDSDSTGDVSQPGCSGWPQNVQQATDTNPVERRVPSSTSTDIVLSRKRFFTNYKVATEQSNPAALSIEPIINKKFNQSQMSENYLFEDTNGDCSEKLDQPGKVKCNKVATEKSKPGARDIDRVIKNKFSQTWMSEEDPNGDLYGDYIKKLDLPGKAECNTCSCVMNYGKRGKIVFEVHAATTKHRRKREEAIKESQEVVYQLEYEDVSTVQFVTDARDVDSVVRNKFLWNWMSERDPNGDLYGNYIKKLDLPGKVKCEICSCVLNYGNGGKSILEHHAETNKHRGLREKAMGETGYIMTPASALVHGDMCRNGRKEWKKEKA